MVAGLPNDAPPWALDSDAPRRSKLKKFLAATAVDTMRTGRNRRWRPAKRHRMSDDELRELLGLRRSG
jgi:hypothetical protein